MSKKTIVVYAIEGAGIGGDWLGCACVEGECIVAQHSCSSEGWVPHDMGVTSDWKHDAYDKACPDGWEIDYRGAVTLDGFLEWAEVRIPKKGEA